MAWLSSGLDESYSALLTARLLNANVSPVHFVWDPEDGTIVQMVSTASTAPYRGIPKDLRDGVVFVMTVGPTPFTSAACKGLDDIMRFFDGCDIPRAFPLGPPGPDGGRLAMLPGHYAYNCGAIDIGYVLRS